MSVIPIDQSEDVVVGRSSIDRSISRTRRHELRYRLVVAAPSVSDVVTLGGGWLFDRVMAGWHVTVLTPGADNPLPLRILGTRVADLDDAMTVRDFAILPQSFAVTAALYEADTQLRKWVQRTLDGGQHEIIVWGPDLPEDLAERTDAAQHRLSSAARAFKTRALAAAGGQTPADDVERFRSAGRPRRAVLRYRL